MPHGIPRDQRARWPALREPLDGIPIAHKDIFDVAGVATTAQSRQFAGLAPKQDAAVVAGLAQASAITLGKLACYEHAFAGPEFNVTGQPAKSVCTDFGEGGLPLAMQLIAGLLQEPMLLRAAHAYEQATSWRGQRPTL